jgi:hypothetical protein
LLSDTFYDVAGECHEYWMRRTDNYFRLRAPTHTTSKDNRAFGSLAFSIEENNYDRLNFRFLSIVVKV